MEGDREMKRRKSLLVAVALSGLLGGCAAQHFSELQTNFDALLTQRQQCNDPGAGARPPPSPVECMADYDAPFASVGKGAAQLAGEVQVDASTPGEKAKADANRVGLYRLAATAYWQAGPQYYQEALDLADKAKALCTPTQPKGGPRDCALVLMLPSLIQVDSFNRQAAELKQQIQQAPADARGKFIPTIVKLDQEYREKIWQGFQEGAATASTLPGLPPAFQDYLKRQRKLGFCGYWSLLDSLFFVYGPDYQRLQGSKHCPPSSAGLNDPAAMEQALAAARADGLNLTPEALRLACGQHFVQLEAVGLDPQATDPAEYCR
jgi:hypothetical protein